LPGINVGHGAVIGAGAVVSKEVAAWRKVAGVPARFIGERFEQSVGLRLEALAWWDWSHDRLEEAVAHFRDLDVHAFLEMYE